MTKASDLYRYLQWCALFAGLICLGFIRHKIHGDGEIRAVALQSLVSSHSLVEMKYSWIGPILALPFVLFDGLNYFNFFVFFLGLVTINRILRPMLNLDERRIFLVLLVFGTTLPFATKDFYGELLSAMGLGIGSILLVRDLESLAAPWLSLAVANSPALFPSLAIVLGFRCIEKKSMRHFWILAPTLLLILGDRWLRFGDLWKSGYEEDRGLQTFLPFSGLSGFSYPFILGVLSILFSFGKGILVYFPGLWIGVSDTIGLSSLSGLRKKLGLYWMLIVLGLVMTYAKWWSWYGGDYWGPRFFAFCSLPASYFLAIFLASLSQNSKDLRRITLGVFLLIFSFWICLSGLLYGEGMPRICKENGFFLESACWYIPEFSAVLMPLFISMESIEPLEFLVPVWIFGFFALIVPILHHLICSHFSTRGLNQKRVWGSSVQRSKQRE